MKITGNTILITGGTAGIGRELVRQFHSFGNKLIVASSSATNLQNLQKKFPDIETIVCDLADRISVKKLITECIEKYEGINVLINNAGIQYNYDWTEKRTDYEKIEIETIINFVSPMNIIYGLIPILIDKKDSAIVNISSALAFAPKKTAPIYCATKSAIHSATKALRYQLENTVVKVFEIVPPLVDTKMTSGRGKGKISPEQLVDKFIVSFKRNKYESNIGKAKMLRLLQRFSPAIADRILKNG